MIFNEIADAIEDLTGELEQAHEERDALKKDLKVFEIANLI